MKILKVTRFRRLQPLCHTCHISKPLRSKHCRIARRCVLVFDHHCPFVGNTIGLDNYKWFYLILFFMALAVLCFLITLGIHLNRQPKMQWGLLWGGLYIGLFLFPSAGMCVYHTQLILLNLTTNEHQNMRRYHYLNEGGRYNNPFSRGYWSNIMDRFSPSEASYTLPEAAMDCYSLVQNPGGSGTHEIIWWRWTLALRSVGKILLVKAHIKLKCVALGDHFVVTIDSSCKSIL